MTKQEAIRILEQSCPKRPQKLWSIKRKEAVNMAIEALNFVSEHHQSNIETYAHDMGVSLEQAERELRVEELSCSEEPNRSDLISRQDAIDAICEHGTDLERRGITVLAVANYKQATVDLLESLPSAQPDLSDDGTLMMTVPHGILSDVKRVMVDEVGTKFCKVMYQDEPERGCDECIFKPFKQFQPEQRVGFWLTIERGEHGYSAGDFRCSVCGEPNHCYKLTKYCASCGALMKQE